VTEGPYYLRDDYVRQDLREGQNGTTLYLDIGVIDTTTCEPAPDMFVEIWACNAQGQYSSFVGSILPTFNISDWIPAPTGTESFDPSATTSFVFPTGIDFSVPKTSTDNFLRGGLPTDQNGMVELTTIFPGFYTGRTVHIHTIIHQNITYNTNGTVKSATGPVRHIGQIFFSEEVNAEIRAQPEYQGTGQIYTSNAEDPYTEGANSGGYNAYADIERLGESLADGLLGYITIGIDTSAAYNISTSNKWDPAFVPTPLPSA
jgi:protocatechuate 3,4-dioxygenase beta subunit